MRVSRRTVLARTVIGSATLAVATAPGMGSALGHPAGAASGSDGYEIGAGLSDITGPAAECGMMGYAQLEQQTAGIHLRPRARAFILGGGGRRIVFVAAENGMIFQSVHRGVLAELARRFGDRYTEQNVVLTSTHSHATCGGSSHDYAYNLSILGFQQQVYDAEVNGIVEAIAAAHDDIGPGTLALGRGELHNASVNRSRVAWERNPPADKHYFPDAIDPAVTAMALFKGGRQIGAITWFATHNTSMTNENHLISSDNKGYAAFCAEHIEHGVRYLDGTPDFVAAFAQTNAGDMSPNLNLRPGSGPTEDEFENTRILGERQYLASKNALSHAEPVDGPVQAMLCYIDLADLAVDGRFTPDGRPRRTAPAAAGVSLIAGSVEDGPGLPGGPIPEGVRNPFLDSLGDPGRAPGWLTDAQAPKAIAIPLGLLPPVAWVPNVLPIQLVRLGALYLAAAGAEFTITAGLRIRRAVAAALNVPLEQVLMQGYANAYHEYVTTPEEYDSQQYEGASTLFGRYTLCAYQQEFTRLASAFAAGQPVPRGPAPRDVSTLQPNFQPGPGIDATPPGRGFGDVLLQPAPCYARGDRVAAEFVSAHPKHDTRRNRTFLEVQFTNASGAWMRTANEGEWAVKFFWRWHGGAVSVARFTWDVPADAATGRYRFQHYATSLGPDGTLTPFTGTTDEFEIA
ncbi:neutral/alkaline ceramidase [Nocardia sp. NPDC049220]|uniref:neutral/alkaline ceramidase n=1 Tax=Nocardia sp. NPDC049220 TaxID=3155273 RepID=UPI00340AD5FF